MLPLRPVVHRKADPIPEGKMTARAATATRRSSTLQAAKPIKRFISPQAGKVANKSQVEASPRPRPPQALSRYGHGGSKSTIAATPETSSTQDTRNVRRDFAAMTTVTVSLHSLGRYPYTNTRENSNQSASPIMMASKTLNNGCATTQQPSKS